MTQPRRIVPGMTAFVTRRALRRHHLFRPDPEMVQLYLYALGACATKYGILVHAAVLMATHEHLSLTDVRGVLPAFLQYFHRIVALGTKCLRKWEGAVWDNDRPSIVELLTPEAMLGQMAYSLANPVEAGLVRYAKDWPGVMLAAGIGDRRVIRIERPKTFFDPDGGHWPDVVELELTWPPSLLEGGWSERALRDALRSELDVREQTARRAVMSARGSFMGRERILRSSPFRRAKSFEPLRSLNPTFAVGRGRRDAFFGAVEQLRAFRAAYRDALERWRRGVRDVVFPVGTWLMRVLHGVAVPDERASA